jgi:hypothetical protein
MPIYAAHCNQCGKDEDYYRTLANYQDIPFCCGVQMERRICAPQVIKDIDPYVSQIDGSLITSRSQHRDHLRQHGCVEVGNEKMEPKTESWIEKKENKEALRQEIAARIDSIS